MVGLYDDDCHHPNREASSTSSSQVSFFFGCTDSTVLTGEQRENRIQVATRDGADVVQACSAA